MGRWYHLSDDERRLALPRRVYWPVFTLSDWLANEYTYDIVFVCDARKMAIWRRGRPKDVIVHSDRGSQYASNADRDLLSEHRFSAKHES